MSVELQDTEIGAFPSAWEINRVDSAFEIQQGKQVSKKNREGDNQRPFLRTKNVFWNRLELSELDQMNFTETEETRLELRPGDLLTCEGGDIGRTALWSDEIQSCYYQNHLHRLRSENGRADPQFSVYWFWYAFNVAKLYFGRGNVTTIPNLSRSKLAELPMVLPPLPEQKKIAHILSTVQQAIEAQKRVIQTTTELKKAIMHKLFTEGLRNEPQKQTEIGPVPRSWEVVTVQDLVDQEILDKPIDGNHGEIHPKVSDFVSEGIPFIMASDLKGGMVDLNTCNFLSKERADRLRKGFSMPSDVLISHKATIGETAIVPEIEHYIMLTPQVTYYRVLDHDALSNEYLRCYFDSPTFQKPLKNVAGDGSTRAYIGITKQRSLPVLVPMIDEQRELASISVRFDEKIRLAVGKKNALDQLFRTLLHELMTAKLRVHNVNINEQILVGSS